MEPTYKSDDGNVILYCNDCLEVMKDLPDCTFDMIYCDPPYYLSGGGTTCSGGQRVCVNKGAWDEKKSPAEMHDFNMRWIAACQKLLKSDGTIWVSGTFHNIFSVGFCMQSLGFKILNDITWIKTNPPPNLSCKFFTHATETIIWAAKSAASKHFYSYAEMRAENGGKQMLSTWKMGPPRKIERQFGRHSTQKPEMLLDRIIRASTKEGDLVMDCFMGSGTTICVGNRLKRRCVGIEMSAEYVGTTIKRIKQEK